MTLSMVFFIGTAARCSALYLSPFHGIACKKDGNRGGQLSREKYTVINYQFFAIYLEKCIRRKYAHCSAFPRCVEV